MKVRALKTQIGDYGKAYPGDEFTVTAAYGKSLIDKGLAEEIETEKEEIEEVKEKKEVKHTSKNKK